MLVVETRRPHAGGINPNAYQVIADTPGDCLADERTARLEFGEYKAMMMLGCLALVTGGHIKAAEGDQFVAEMLESGMSAVSQQARHTYEHIVATRFSSYAAESAALLWTDYVRAVRRGYKSREALVTESALLNLFTGGDNYETWVTRNGLLAHPPTVNPGGSLVPKAHGCIKSGRRTATHYSYAYEMRPGRADDEVRVLGRLIAVGTVDRRGVFHETGERLRPTQTVLESIDAAR